MPQFPSFSAFFTEVHGHAPYVWQERLAAHIAASGHVPDQVAIPTGLGKTSTVDAAVWGLARQVSLKTTRTIGQRIILAVERQIIVNGVADHLRTLESAVNDPVGPATSAVSTALGALGGDRPLTASAFHGSLKDGRLWHTPCGAQIITTTLTQLTLRALGRAPSASSRTASIQAGLVMVDSTILVDEPHLATHQVQALQDMVRIQQAYQLPVPPPRLTVLGATIPSGLVASDVLDFAPEEEEETGHARDRWTAPRPLHVHTAPAPSENKLVDATVEAVVTRTVEQLKDDRHPRPRVTVVLNSVGAARRTYAKMVREVKAAKLGYSVDLLTGRKRPVDRPTAEELGRAGVITVATQVVEAGADFTCDLLVTEVASWGAVVQRIGRLNRDGSAAYAKGIVVVPALEDGTFGTPASRAIYGEGPVAACAAGLVSLYEEANAGDRERARSVSASLDRQAHITARILSEAESRGVDAEPVTPTPATITPAVASAYLATSTPSVDTAGVLSGIDPVTGVPPVTVAWREAEDTQRLTAVLDAAPLMAAETVSVPLWEASAILKGKLSASLVDADSGVDAGVDSGARAPKTDPVAEAVVYRRGEWTPATEIIPGDTVVFVSAAGGYIDAEGVGASKAPVSDVSVLLALRGSGTAALTVSGLVRAGMGVENASSLMEGLEDSTVAVRTRRHAAGDILSRESGNAVAVRTVKGVVTIGPAPRPGRGPDGLVTLEDHLVQTGEVASRYAGALGLDVSVYRTAGQLHDAGKATPAFQRMLGARSGDPLLAKSTGRTSLTGALAGVPAGYRHEISSATAARTAGVTDELTLWLVESHHGETRGPGRRADTAVCEPRRMALENVYGPWGLAYLESVFRIADHEVSASPEAPTERLLPVVTDTLALLTAGVDRMDIPYVESAGTDVPLTGMEEPAEAAWYAAVGALSVISDDDPTATLWWDGRTPVLRVQDPASVSSVMERAGELWSDVVNEVHDVVGAALFGKYTKLYSPHGSPVTSCDAAIPEDVAALAARHPGTARGRLMSALFPPHLVRGELPKGASAMPPVNRPDGTQLPGGGRASAVSIPMILPHSASTLDALANVDAGDPAALFDLSVGWATGTAAMTAAGHIGVSGAADPGRVRVGFGVLTLLGTLLGPAPNQHPGVLARKRVLPTPGDPWPVAAFAAALRAPVAEGPRIEAERVSSDKSVYTPRAVWIK